MPSGLNRRAFLRGTGIGAISALILGRSGQLAADPQPQETRRAFKGIFAILLTPFTSDDRMHYQDLEREVDFCVRAGAHGVVWPQLAGEFYMLSEEERRRGAEICIKVAGGRLPVVIGVQAPSERIAVMLARHAEEKGASAVIALPPYLGQVYLETVADYFRSLVRSISLPVFVQNTGGSWGPALPTSFVIGLARENPRVGYIKEEVAPVSHRLAEYARSGAISGMFSGNAGRNLLNELAHGSSGTMPAPEFIDVDAQIYERAASGKMDEARALFAKLLPMINMEQTYGIAFAKEVLVRRGVFKTAKMRGVLQEGLDSIDRQELDAWWGPLAPHLRV